MTFSMLLFGLLLIVSGLGVVCSPKTLTSALFLVVSLFLVAIHFALIGADFLAALQVMVYAGAIMVLVVFVIMLLGLDEQGERERIDLKTVLALVGAGCFIGLLVWGISVSWSLSGESLGLKEAAKVKFAAAGPAEVGNVLLREFLYPFEITSVLLLAAIIGAVLLAHDKRSSFPVGRGLSAKRKELGTDPSAPASTVATPAAEAIPSNAVSEGIVS